MFFDLPISQAKVICTTLVSAAVLLSSAAFGKDIEPDELTDQHVSAAIEALVEELYERKDANSFWDSDRGRGDGSQFQTGGYTALVVLSLLYAGESYQNPRLADAIAYLQELEMEGTYAVAVRAMIWAMLPPRFRPNLERDARWLINGFSRDAGGWAYYQLPTTTVRDNSLRQYGGLGLWEAARRGVRVPNQLWQALERGYLEMRLADGGWNYRGSGPATGSMTAAGVGTLFMIQDIMHAGDRVRIRSRPDPSEAERALESGLNWLSENFKPDENPGRDQYFYYYLYGVERVGLASGYKYFGEHDWYREGAAELIHRLCAWDPQTETMTVHRTLYGDGRRARLRSDDLAFALLFLSRGRVPVAFNKLEDDRLRWNNRPRDVANLSRWLSDETAGELNWQIVGIDTSVEEWFDAPVLYFASHQSIPWLDGADESSPEVTRLRSYLEGGGMLFAVQEDTGRDFARSIRTLGTLAFPQYEWRPLPSDHWVFSAHTPIRSDSIRLEGLSNGVRELIILAVDGDLSASYQRGISTARQDDYALAGNIFLHASEMNRAPARLAALDDQADPIGPDAEPADGRRIRVARARHQGNWNPEPAALDRFRRVLIDRDDLNLTIEHVPLAEIHDTQPRPDLVIVSGTDAVSFSADQRDAMVRFVREGGVILFETSGGMGPFAHDAERRMRGMLGAEAVDLARSELIRGTFSKHAPDLSQVDYRPFTLDVLGSLETRSRLRGIIVDDHPRVIFSREDLSHALLNRTSWGINGYSPTSARRLLRSIALYAGELND